MLDKLRSQIVVPDIYKPDASPGFIRLISREVLLDSDDDLTLRLLMSDMRRLTVFENLKNEIKVMLTQYIGSQFEGIERIRLGR